MGVRAQILAATIAGFLLNACQSPTSVDGFGSFELIDVRGDIVFPAPRDSAGVLAGEFVLQSKGQCRRFIDSRVWVQDSLGARLVELTSEVRCRWRVVSSRKIELEWEGGTPVGWDRFLVGPDSAVLQPGRLSIYVFIGVSCFTLPCPRAWVEEYREVAEGQVP